MFEKIFAYWFQNGESRDSLELCDRVFFACVTTWTDCCCGSIRHIVVDCRISNLLFEIQNCFDSYHANVM